MTPERFLSDIAKQKFAPVYLFAGPDAYYRKVCRETLVTAFLGEDTEGLTRFDLDDIPLSAVFDDASSLSLFTAKRLIWVTGAEAALPRRLTSGGDEDGKTGPTDTLKHYLKSPTSDVVVVLECSRYDFSGDDKARLDRVLKFYSAIPDVVELRPLPPEGLRRLAQELLSKNGLRLEPRDLAFLVDSVGGDANRLGNEVEKLALFASDAKALPTEAVRALIANGAQSNIFALVNALARRDRSAALGSLSLLARDGEYLPLALTFLGTQFRMTLAAQEARLNQAQAVVNHFTKLGVRIWRDRAEQILATAAAFRPEQLRRALRLIYEADKNLRDARPDDRIVLESLILRITA